MDDIKVSQFKRINIEEYKNVYKLYKNGWAMHSIAEKYSISPMTVKKILKNNFDIINAKIA